MIHLPSSRLIALYFLVSFAALSAFAVPVRADEEPILDIKIVENDLGIQTWLVEDHNLPIVVLRFEFLNAGASTDTKELQGLARMASNTMDEGAADLDSRTFQKLLQDNSISLGFSASRDNFGGSLQTLSSNKELAFDLLYKALNEPRFDQEAIDRMRDANIARIRSSLTNPSWVAARIMNDTAFGDHPYALNSGGTLSSLPRITAEHLRDFVNTRLARENLRLSVVGDITEEELQDVLKKVFGKLPEKPDVVNEAAPVTLQNQGQTVLYVRDIPQTIVSIAHPGIDHHHPDYFTAKVMNYILGGGGFGSRLTVEAREKRGLTYGIGSYLMDMDDADLLIIQTSTKNENVGKMLQIVREQIAGMTEKSVLDQGLELAKSYMVGSLPLSLTSTKQIANMMMSIQELGLPTNYLDMRKDAISAVTKEDILRVSKSLLKPEALTTILVGKPEGVEPTMRIEILPNVE